MKRILSVALVLCVILSCTAIFAGCGSKNGKDWPVTVAGVTIKEEPENVVILNDVFADIVSYIGYDVKMVGRSEECDQEDYADVIPAMGTAAAPDVNAIIAADTDLVIADKTLGADAKSQLEAKGAQVITFDVPTTEEQLKELYKKLGTALGGKETGSKKGEKGYSGLIDMLNTMNTATSDIVQTVAYLYLDENNQLCTFTKGSLPYRFFNYNGKPNVFLNQAEPAINPQELRIGSPNYIFYDSEEVLAALAADEQFQNVSALKNNATLMIPKKFFERYGISTEDAIYEMLNFIESTSRATADEAAPTEVTPTEDASETAPEETAAAAETTAAEEDDTDPDDEDVISYSIEE